MSKSLMQVKVASVKRIKVQNPKVRLKQICAYEKRKSYESQSTIKVKAAIEQTAVV